VLEAQHTTPAADGITLKSVSKPSSLPRLVVTNWQAIAALTESLQLAVSSDQMSKEASSQPTIGSWQLQGILSVQDKYMQQPTCSSKGLHHDALLKSTNQSRVCARESLHLTAVTKLQPVHATPHNIS
jgi:hypothetical protein